MLKEGAGLKRISFPGCATIDEYSQRKDAMIYRGKITRIDNLDRLWVEVPRLGIGMEFGPCETVAYDVLAPGDYVLVVQITGEKEDVLIVGKARPKATGNGNPGGGSGNPNAHKYDVRDYGATSNVATHQAAFDAAVADAEGAAATGPETASQKIQRLWGPVGTVVIPGGVYEAHVTLGNRVSLRGSGIGSTILKRPPGWAGSVVSIGAHSRMNDISGLTIDGNVSAGGTTMLSHGIALDNSLAADSDPIDGTAVTVDSWHMVHNVRVQNCGGDGILQDGRGAVQMNGVEIDYVGRFGVNINLDSFMTSVDIGKAGWDGIYIKGGAVHISNCKAWYCGWQSNLTPAGVTNGVGYGVHFANGNYSPVVITNMGVQDNARSGLYLNNVGGHIIQGIVADSNNSKGLGHSNIEVLNSYDNIIGSAISMDRNQHPNHPVASFKVDGGARNDVSVRTGSGLSYMPSGRFTGYPWESKVEYGQIESRSHSAVSGAFKPKPYETKEHILTIAGATTIDAPDAPHYGQIFRLVLKQNGTGGYPVTFNAAYLTNVVPATTANSTTSITFRKTDAGWEPVVL